MNADLNGDFLAAAGHWMKLRLLRQTAPSDVSAEDLTTAGERVQSLLQHEPPPALRRIGTALALSPFEEQILLLAAMVELDTDVARLCARAHGDAAMPFATFALAFLLFDDPYWEAVMPEAPLRHFQLLHVETSRAHSLVTAALRIDEPILHRIKGIELPDARLRSLASADLPPVPWLPPSQRQAMDEWLHRITQLADEPRVELHLLGGSTANRRDLAAALAAELRCSVLPLNPAVLPNPTQELEALVRLWQREARLMPMLLLLELPDVPDSEALLRLERFLDAASGLVLLSSREPVPRVTSTPVLRWECATPTTAERLELWTMLLEGDEIWPTRLAAQFPLGAGDIQRAAHAARLEGDGPGDRVWDLCRQMTRPALGGLTQRLEPKARWEDLILSEDAALLLRRLTAQVRLRQQVYEEWRFLERMNRGTGISALFSGQSGTGKTMAAEVIANDLRLDLYRIDLSAIVSKYIGETEKNLRRVFDAAEDSGAILFFDEADALFGKRSEVKDSHDRYANIEIDYLLQRMEAYRGLAILATNQKQDLDQAFLRRLRFVINFPFPALVERKRIWQRAFPLQVPLGQLDYDRLARLDLTGGSIHNIALQAAFLAAAATPPRITMPIVFDAARQEYRKLEKPVHEAEFRWNESATAAPPHQASRD